jgi:hypothetical protein
MTRIVNALAEYNQLMQAPPIQAFPGGLAGHDLQNVIDGYYRTAGNDAAAQFRRDAALWYGAYTLPDTADVGVLQKVFAILYYGGLQYKRANGWHPWHTGNIPIASAVSHTARVVVQLPLHNPHDPNADIWGWLNTTAGAIQARGNATHNFQPYDNSPHPEMVNGRPRRIKERKSKGFTGDHFYMNVALGGAGNRHPYSRNVIAADGHHGHLYFCYQAPTAAQFGGLLIAVEQSASADAVQLGPGIHRPTFLRAVAGVPDQYGGSHGLGGHNRYSSTGGDDWTKGALTGHGPDQYIDGLYVDLADPLVYTFVRNNAGNFTAANLGDTGVAAPPPRPQTPAPAPARPPRAQTPALQPPLGLPPRPLGT